MSETYSARTPFQRAVRYLLDGRPDADPLTLAAQVTIPVLNDDDRRTNPTYPIQAVARALFAKELAGWSYPELERQLEANPAQAHELGFEESAPDQSSFWRYWNAGYLTEDVRVMIHRNAEWTRNHATEIDHPIGASALKPDKKGRVSKRTESRLIREKLKTVPQEMVRLVADEWDFLPPRAQNRQYALRSFIETECLMSVKQLAAEQGSEIYNDDRDGPDGDTMLYYVKQLEVDDILRRLHNSTGLMVNRAKRYLEFKRPATVAIDITEVPYYGAETDSEWLVDRRGYTDKKHDWAFRFAAISIVEENVRFVLAIEPVPAGMDHASVVDSLLTTARHHIAIELVYADRAFATAGVITKLSEHPVKYLIPVPKNIRIKREIQRMKWDVKVIPEYGFYEGTEGGRTYGRAETTLALVPSTRDETKTVPFYTNLDVDDEIGLDRRRTKQVVNRYRRRWGIENAFKSLKTFLPWTTSNAFVIRLFHFAFGVLMYNLWRLIDFLIQQSIEGCEVRYKPRLKAKRFINAIRTQKLLG